jgi:hypothetical protein
VIRRPPEAASVYWAKTLRSCGLVRHILEQCEVIEIEAFEHLSGRIITVRHWQISFAVQLSLQPRARPAAADWLYASE